MPFCKHFRPLRRPAQPSLHPQSARGSLVLLIVVLTDWWQISVLNTVWTCRLKILRAVYPQRLLSSFAASSLNYSLHTKLPMPSSNSKRIPSISNAFDVTQYAPTKGEVGTEITVDIRLTKSAFSEYGTIAFRLVIGRLAVETSVAEFCKEPSSWRLRGRVPPDQPMQRARGTYKISAQIVNLENALLDEAVFGFFEYVSTGKSRPSPNAFSFIELSAEEPVHRPRRV